MCRTAFNLASGALVALAALAAPAGAAAQAFPSKPVRMVVPYPAGGATDYVTRLIGERLSKSLGQPVIVENKSGAAGAIGVSEVARAEPDGHTMFIINDPLVNNTALFKKLPYDPKKDFAFVAQILRSPALISAATGAGIADFEDDRALKRAQQHRSMPRPARSCR